MKFCWATISVKDMNQSIAFYKDIIGLKVNRRVQAGPTKELAFLGNGETQVELVCDTAETVERFGENISLGFEVESVNDFAGFLKGMGIAIHSGPFQPNPFIRFFFIKDPDGLQIQFVENVIP